MRLGWGSSIETTSGCIAGQLGQEIPSPLEPPRVEQIGVSLRQRAVQLDGFLGGGQGLGPPPRLADSRCLPANVSRQTNWPRNSHAATQAHGLATTAGTVSPHRGRWFDPSPAPAPVARRCSLRWPTGQVISSIHRPAPRRGVSHVPD